MRDGSGNQPDQQDFPALIRLDYGKPDEIAEVTGVGHVPEGQIDGPDNEPLDAWGGIEQVAALGDRIVPLTGTHRRDLSLGDVGEVKHNVGPGTDQVCGSVLYERFS